MIGIYDENLLLYSNKLEQLKGQKKIISDNYEKTARNIQFLKADLKDSEKAQFIIQQVAKETQENLIFNIENVVTSALQAVFDEPYKFKVIFDVKRNKTDCKLLFEKDGHLFNPLDSSGYGAADIASFGLRIAAWSLRNPKSAAVFILDEPFKHLSIELQEKGSALIKELSEQLGIQFIIITHVNAISEFSDKVFIIKKSGLYSTIQSTGM